MNRVNSMCKEILGRHLPDATMATPIVSRINGAWEDGRDKQPLSTSIPVFRIQGHNRLGTQADNPSLYMGEVTNIPGHELLIRQRLQIVRLTTLSCR